MFRTMVSVLFVALLCASFPISAQSKPEIKFRRQIFVWGTNQIVKLKLRSKEKLIGRVVQIKSDSFVLEHVGAGGQTASRDISYSEVDKLSRHQDAPDLFPDWSTRKMIIFGAIVLVVQLVVTGTNNKY